MRCLPIVAGRSVLWATSQRRQPGGASAGHENRRSYVPAFDDCGMTEAPMIADEAMNDSSAAGVPSRRVISSDGVSITYCQATAERHDSLVSIPVEVR